MIIKGFVWFFIFFGIFISAPYAIEQSVLFTNRISNESTFCIFIT